MQEISNSLRDRLKARPAPKVHPDPDLLTAYVEQVLPTAERNQVVQHLADCGYCREIVSLSLPEPQPESVAAQAPARSRWWIPAYRWAAAAATIAIAATLIIEKPWQSKPTRPFQQSAQAPVVENSQIGTGTPAAQPATTQPATTQPTAESAASVTEAKDKAASAGDSTVTSNIVSAADGPTLRDDRARRADKPQAAFGVVGGLTGQSRSVPAPQPPPPSQVVAREHAEQGARTEASYAYASRKDVPADYVNRDILSNNNKAADANSNGGPLPEAPPAKVAAPSLIAEQERRNAPKISDQDLETSKMEVSVGAPQLDGAGSAPSASESTLAKSSGAFKITSKVHDAINKTVQTVKKAGAPSSMAGTFVAPSSIAGISASTQTHWTIKKGKLLRSSDLSGWHEVYSEGPDIQFRVVEPRGREVWAGGNHGALIHSWDAGVNWDQMNVPDSSSSDVTGISIDGDNVQVRTSNGQTFVSNDHGATWVPLQQPK